MNDAGTFPIAGGPWPFRDTWGAARGNGRTHKGTDIPAPEGTAIVAMFPGTVTFSSDNLGGNTASLATDRGTFYYAHLSSQRVDLAGQTVQPGTVLGAVGNTGNSYGAHLHLGWLVAGAHRNPYELLTQLAGTPATPAVGTVAAGGIDLPGLPGADALADLAGILTEPVKAFLAAAAWVQDRDNWVRILQVAAAVWVGSFGLALLFGPRALEAAGPALGLIPGGSVAAGAARSLKGA